MAVRGPRALQRVPRLVPATVESSPSVIGLITLGEKCAGARSAGNPHAACEAEGTGNGATANPKRARRGKPMIQPRAVLQATAPVLDPTARAWPARLGCDSAVSSSGNGGFARPPRSMHQRRVKAPSRTRSSGTSRSSATGCEHGCSTPKPSSAEIVGMGDLPLQSEPCSNAADLGRSPTPRGSARGRPTG